MQSTIRFYKTHDKYGCFSNFSRHPIVLKNRSWPTTEHYFQAQKFAGTKYEEQIRMATGPMEAAKQGRDRKKPLRKDWELVKESVMYEAIKAKFTQYLDLRNILLSTGELTIIEDSPIDNYWGCGSDGTGKNRLGVLLMKLREELCEKE